MKDNFSDVVVGPEFALKHTLTKFALGFAAGKLIQVTYDKTVVIPALKRLREIQKVK